MYYSIIIITEFFNSIRDLGIYLYTTEIQAINNYWFNLYGDVFDSSYKNNAVGMVWGSKYVHGIWWTADPIEIHGINWMPITGASLYLGTDPDYIKRNLGEMWAEVNAYTGPDKNLEMWQDIVCEYLALYDPDFSVTADTPVYSVFKKGSTKTYVVYNASDSIKRGTFSDGKVMSVSPRSTGVGYGTGLNPTPAQPTPVQPTLVSDVLLIDDFNSAAAWQAKKNDLNKEVVTNGGLYNLEGDKNLHFFYNGGKVSEYFDTYINKNVSGYDYLVINIKGNVGGEESTLSISMNDGAKSTTLPFSKYGTLSGDYKDIFIPLADFGVNLSSIKYIRLAGTGNAQTVKGDGKYSEACDLNSDGAVNMSDVIILSRVFNTVLLDNP